MKRGQMEMAGLVIIVILITLGMLFALLFFVKKEPTEKKIFVRKGLAYSTMGTLLKTSVPCQDGETTSVKMVDLLEDCARQVQFRGRGQYQCQEANPPDPQDLPGSGICAYAKGEINELLTSTLVVWKRDYYLEVKLLPEPLLFNLGTACPGEQDSSGVFPEQTEVGILQSQLVICG